MNVLVGVFNVYCWPYGQVYLEQDCKNLVALVEAIKVSQLSHLFFLLYS